MPPHETATTGPDNPLHEFTPSEQAALTQAEGEAKAAFDRFRAAKEALAAARARGAGDEQVERLAEERDRAEEAARAREEVAKGLQDFCD